MTDMTIGAAANRSGVSAKMILHHYETIGLVATPARQQNNYPTYDASVCSSGWMAISQTARM